MDELLKWLKALGEISRLRLVALLHEGGERPVNELVRIMGQSQPRVSHHLKSLSDAGIVERYSEGAFVFYRLSSGAAGEFVRKILQAQGTDFLEAKDRRALENQMEAQNAAATHYFDQHAEEWDRLRAGQIDEDAVNKAIFPLIKPYFPIEKFLDVGTGAGAMLQLLAPYVKAGEGVDLSRPMLELARARLAMNGDHHCRVRQADMHHMGYEDDYFQLVIMNLVLHFSDQPERAVKEAARVLAQDGIFIITDFAPHQQETLRQSQTHRWLGFSQEQISMLCRDLPVSLLHALRLDPQPNSTQLPIHVMLFKKHASA
ncbi:MAG: ArsR/SmtB family transcription factor [Alphaproteobacteria bacterium]